MEHFILIVHIFVALGLIGFILVQHGKGAEVGASFGSGASQTIFGSQGSGNFLTRVTAILVTIFFITCLSLGYFNSRRSQPQDLDEILKKVQPHAVKPAETKAAESKPMESKSAEPEALEKAKQNIQDNDIPVINQENKETPPAVEKKPE